MRRGVAFVALAVVAVLGTSTGASARQQTTVSLSGTTPMGVRDQCMTEPTTSPGSFTFTRTSTEGVLTITYHISGGPTDLNSDAAAGEDHTVNFADGEATATVVVHPSTDATDATVTVVAGEVYAVGEPSSGTVAVQHIGTICDPVLQEESTTTANTLARTGIRSTSGRLALVGITSLALGSLLVVLSSRRKATGLR
jgi:hypothetical protein